MRILAPCKRDSVTGEEEILAVAITNVVNSSRSTQHSSSANNNYTDSAGLINRRSKDISPPVDFLLKEKLRFHQRASSNCDKSLVPSSSSPPQVPDCQKQKPLFKGNKSKWKAEVRKCNSVCLSNWRNRIRNSVKSLFVIVLSSHCCVELEHKKRDLCLKKHGTKKVCKNQNWENNNQEGNNVTKLDSVEIKGISRESQSYASEKCSNNINSCEESSPDLFLSDNYTKVSANNSSLIILVPGVVGKDNINVENTTKPASDTNLVAATETANIKIMRTGIYHEKQVKSLCALHALNNLLQDGKAFKQEDLDKICSELDPNSWVNPHKSVFGLGNYDINVIMTALQQKNLEAVWFDKRKDPSDELNFGNIYGFILNIPSDCRLGWLALPIKRKHWVAIRNLPSPTEKDAGRNNYHNLDSKFDKPESIGSTDNLIEYLRSELKSAEKELFLVVTEDIGRLETWRRNPPPPPSLSSVGATISGSVASGSSTHLLPVPTTSGESGPDAAAGSGNNRRTSNDSGVVDLLPDLRDINVVDLNKEDLMRRQSSGVWSDLT